MNQSEHQVRPRTTSDWPDKNYHLAGKIHGYKFICVDIWGTWGEWGPCQPDCMTGKRVRTRPCTHDIICGDEIGMEEEYCDFTMCDSGASFTAAVTKDGFLIGQLSFNQSD